MTLEQLHSFLAVLEQGSFTSAATARGISQSTVSFHIRALEQSVGVRLVDRGAGTVCPTQPGRVLRAYAVRIANLSTEAVTELRTSEASPAGRLVIHASTVVSAYLVPALLLEFRRRCPRVTVIVEEASSASAADALANRNVDLALVGSPVTDRRFESEPFAEDEIVLVGRPNGRTSLDCATELAKLPLILRDPGSGTSLAIGSVLEHADPWRPDVVRVGSTEAARRCVLEGLGYTFISRSAVHTELEDGRLQIVEVPGTPCRRLFHIARLASATPSPAASAFHSLTRECKDTLCLSPESATVP